MRTFSPTQPDAGSEDPAGVVPLDKVSESVRGTFTVFAEKLAAEGFAFLDARIRDGGTGPVLTVQRDNSIVGAIGPMEIMPDSRGAAQLLPQYFGVLPEYRGYGLGRSGGPPCTGDSDTRLPTSSCRLKSAAHRTACASRKDSPTSVWSAPPRSEPTPTYPGRPYGRRDSRVPHQHARHPG